MSSKSVKHLAWDLGVLWGFGGAPKTTRTYCEKRVKVATSIDNEDPTCQACIEARASQERTAAAVREYMEYRRKQERQIWEEDLYQDEASQRLIQALFGGES